jgi:predicted GNAT family N-acyltransferase
MVCIGSIATPSEQRGKGLASNLIKYVVSKINSKKNTTNIFLYADIAPEFYEKFGFVRLPDRFQKYKNSICMARGGVNDDTRVHDYF